MTRERVQKLLSQAGLASRREAEEWIVAGRVTVNGETAELGSRADGESDDVRVDGKPLPARGARRYLLLNKPRGCLTTHRDPAGRPTVFDLLPPKLRPGLKAVGRLDFQTEGLLLLTDDGELAQLVAHPRHGGIKTYAVKVRGIPVKQRLDRLRSGIPIDGRRTRPASIRRRSGERGSRSAVTNSWWTVQIAEGRNRQIREMFQRIGHPVLKLRRVGIGGLTDSRLPVGHYRELSAEEVDLLRGGEAARRKGARGTKKGTGWAVAKRRKRTPGRSSRRRVERKDGRS